MLEELTHLSCLIFPWPVNFKILPTWKWFYATYTRSSKHGSIPVQFVSDIEGDGSRKVATKYHYCDWIQYLKRTLRGKQHNINANETSNFCFGFPMIQNLFWSERGNSFTQRSDQWESSSHNQKCNQILIIAQCK